MAGDTKLVSSFAHSRSDPEARLRSLRLRKNSLGPEGAAALASALQDHASLTAVKLEENRCGPQATQRALLRYCETR